MDVRCLSCNKLLAKKVEVMKASIKCKCGCVNSIEVPAFQERMSLIKK